MGDVNTINMESFLYLLKKKTVPIEQELLFINLARPVGLEPTTSRFEV